MVVESVRLRNGTERFTYQKKANEQPTCDSLTIEEAHSFIEPRNKALSFLSLSLSLALSHER